jgi:hypothetical protein
VKAKLPVVLLMAAMVFGALASSVRASAASRHYRRPASVVAEVELHGTAGFELSLVAFNHSMDLSVTKGIAKLGEEGVTYSSRRPAASAGYFDGNGLNVRIGRLGRFRARFVVKSIKTEAVSGECKGDPPTIEQGYFVGLLDFRGERGYSSAHARRAPGTVTRIASARCARSPSFRPDDEFRLVASDRNADTILRASREEVSAGSKVTPTSFLVSVASESGELAVIHSAFVLDFHADPGATFRTPNLAEPLTEATLRPPAPFSGSANFRLESPLTAKWTGDLTVELPGLGGVPLAGDEFQAGLCKGRSNCTEPLPPHLAQIFESGIGFGARSGTISIVGTRTARAAAGI